MQGGLLCDMCDTRLCARKIARCGATLASGQVDRLVRGAILQVKCKIAWCDTRLSKCKSKQIAQHLYEQISTKIKIQVSDGQVQFMLFIVWSYLCKNSSYIS